MLCERIDALSSLSAGAWTDSDPIFKFDPHQRRHRPSRKHELFNFYDQRACRISFGKPFSSPLLRPGRNNTAQIPKKQIKDKTIRIKRRGSLFIQHGIGSVQHRRGGRIPEKSGMARHSRKARQSLRPKTAPRQGEILRTRSSFG